MNRKRTLSGLFFTFSVIVVCLTSCKQTGLDVTKELQSATKQYLILKSELLQKGDTLFPKTYDREKDELITSDSRWWCSGFYPGTLFYLSEETDNPKLYSEGLRMLKVLEKEQYNTTTHDIGFMMYCSFGNANRIAPKPEYKEILITSANSLCTRFNPVVGCIRSHNRNPEDYIVIIDNMMNLELLFWVAEATGDKTYYDIAVIHANTTMKNHFRQDGSAYHALDYDAENASIKRYIGGQGYSENSAWARGQAWAIYGYTMVYRCTGDKKYLDQAVKIADFYLNHPNLPKDKIPYWDFNAPEIPDALRDVSAGSITCSALLELYQYVEPVKSKEYFTAAETMLHSLSSENYKAIPGTCRGFILDHSVGNMPAGTEVDAPLSYADYYYVEALHRYKNILK